MRSAGDPADIGGVGTTVVGGGSWLFKGMAGSWHMLNGPLKIAPKSGFSSLRYWVYQPRFTLSCKRFVSRLPIFVLSTPVAILPGNVRNLSRFTSSAP